MEVEDTRIHIRHLRRHRFNLLGESLFRDIPWAIPRSDISITGTNHLVILTYVQDHTIWVDHEARISDDFVHERIIIVSTHDVDYGSHLLDSLFNDPEPPNEALLHQLSEKVGELLLIGVKSIDFLLGGSVGVHPVRTYVPLEFDYFPFIRCD